MRAFMAAQPMLMPVDMRIGCRAMILCLSCSMRWRRSTSAGSCVAIGPMGTAGAAYDSQMMIALLLYAYCHEERSSRVIQQRCVRDVAYRVIVGRLHPDHATIARFRERHEGTW